MVSPRFFIIFKNQEDVLKMEGWSDPLVGAQYHGLRIVDRDDPQDYQLWVDMANKRRRKRRPDTRKFNRAEL